MEKVFMFLSFFLGFLSVVMAFVLSWNTNKLVRTEDERAKSLIKETQKMIEKMDERWVKMDERHQETMRYLQQSLDYLGSLIKADGEKTRELINKVLEKIPG
jgi:DNA-directed RNA polymerase subunit F